MTQKINLDDLKIYKNTPDNKVVIIIRNNINKEDSSKYLVYDVTKYLESHPGGEDILIENSAIDASNEFWDTGHSDYALKQMKEFIIGELDEESVNELKSREITHINRSNPSMSIYNVISFLFVVLSIYLYFFMF